MSPVKVAIGLPLYNQGKHLRESLESLLSQTDRRFGLVLVDDASIDETPWVAAEYAEGDPRVVYHRNEQRLGMTANWRRAFELAHQHFPEAEYFAWASDHDVWHPRWLELVLPAIDENPAVVLAYPLNLRISDAGEAFRDPWHFDMRGVKGPVRRLRRALAGMSAGNMVYGLIRIDALKRAGVFRRVLLPDRLLVAELALYGQLAQVPDVLWFRRYGGLLTMDRQRKSFFPDGAPLHTWLPWWLSHGAVLFWNLALAGRGKPSVGRLRGAVVALTYVEKTARLRLRHRAIFVRKKVGHRWRRLRGLPWGRPALAFERLFGKARARVPQPVS